MGEGGHGPLLPSPQVEGMRVDAGAPAHGSGRNPRIRMARHGYGKAFPPFLSAPLSISLLSASPCGVQGGGRRNRFRQDKGRLPSPWDERIKTMKKMITHGGKAHLDDVFACALALVDRAWGGLENGHAATVEAALADACEGVVIERREPTEDELANPHVLVIDVGGHYRPELGNFDHHQFPKGTKESAMSLFAASIGLPDSAFDGTAEYVPDSTEYPGDSLASFLEDAYPWFRTRVALDACGPFQAAKENGVEWSTVERFLGPCEEIVLKVFEDAEPEARVDVVRPLAEAVLRRHAAWERVVSAVKYDRPRWGDGDFTIADFTKADPADAEACSEMFTRHVDGVAVFHDDRGEGLTLLRLRDDPRIDFTRVKNDPEAAFCHNGGFIVKTKSKDLGEAWRLVEGAYVGK